MLTMFFGDKEKQGIFILLLLTILALNETFSLLEKSIGSDKANNIKSKYL